jgi:hypothetical protein
MHILFSLQFVFCPRFLRRNPSVLERAHLNGAAAIAIMDLISPVNVPSFVK